ncbi:hypothetical protein MKEN_00424800 [Mycena kentingensis (nom. inval.)]|nr:hypothetical protein MKEN_00424800 [Mycena kentingensis (nom. inval.)]
MSYLPNEDPVSIATSDESLPPSDWASDAEDDTDSESLLTQILWDVSPRGSVDLPTKLDELIEALAAHTSNQDLHAERALSHLRALLPHLPPLRSPILHMATPKYQWQVDAVIVDGIEGTEARVFSLQNDEEITRKVSTASQPLPDHFLLLNARGLPKGLPATKDDLVALVTLMCDLEVHQTDRLVEDYLLLHFVDEELEGEDGSLEESGKGKAPQPHWIDACDRMDDTPDVEVLVAYRAIREISPL